MKQGRNPKTKKKDGRQRETKEHSQQGGGGGGKEREKMKKTPSAQQYLVQAGDFISSVEVIVQVSLA